MENKFELINDLSDIELILLVFGNELYTKTLDSLHYEYDTILSKLRKLLYKNKYSKYKTPQDIINLMIIKYNLPSDFALSKSRERNLYVEPRQKAMVLCRHIFTNLSLANIGDYFGKDHATVLHSKKTVKNLYKTNTAYRNDFDEMQIYFLGRIKITFND